MVTIIVYLLLVYVNSLLIIIINKRKSTLQRTNLLMVLFQAMIFETAFQNLVVLIYVVKTDLFCFMRSAFLLYITLISCHNYLNI